MQRSADLRWIREPFLNHRGDFDLMVVHGHTISSQVEMMPNRIGIDTGGYATGRLTALGLEADEKWVLQTRPLDQIIPNTSDFSCEAERT
jgi:serine/threonine protein phosphatase 1